MELSGDSINDRQNMIASIVKATCVTIAVCTLVFASLGRASAMEKQFPDGNFAITVPDDWHAVTNFPPQRSLVAVYADATGNRIVLLVINQKKPVGPLDDRFITEYEKGIEESGGGNRLSGKYIEVGGIKSYERLGSLDTNGKHISTMILLVPSEDNYCNVQGMRLNGNAGDDPEIQQIISSFRFLHPFVPTYAPDSAAFQIGKLMGSLMVVVVVVVGVRSLTSMRSNRPAPRPPPSRPPPVPPGAH
jgi:hypothetical protein